MFVRYALGVDINRTAVGRFPVLAFPAVCRQVQVIIHIIFAQTDDAQGQTVAVLITERNGVPLLDALAAGKFRCQDGFPLFWEGDGLSAFGVQIPVIAKARGVLRDYHRH